MLAFEGAFEKLFNIVTQEGGAEGGLVTEGALSCVDSLLRFNSSDQVSQLIFIRTGCLIAIQSYFRETTFPQLLCSLLFFPWKISDKDPAPQEFSLQFWDEQKAANTGFVIGIMGILVGSKGGNVNCSRTYRCCLTYLLGSRELHIYKMPY